MGTLNLTAITPDTPYIKKIRSALEKATGQSIPLVEIKKVQRKGGVSVVPVFLVFAGGQELTLFARASADVFKAELNGKEIILPGDFSDDYKQTFDNAVSGIAKLIRESQAKVEQQNQKEKVKLPPRKNRSIQQQISDKREEETQLDQELSNLTAQRDQLVEQLKQAQTQMEGGETIQGKQIAEGQSSAFDSVDWDEKIHPRDENGKFSVKLNSNISIQHRNMPLYRTDWGDFPNTVIDRSLGDATSHPLYESAKSGNIEDAYQLAKDLVSDDAINRLLGIIGERNITIVPVHAEESVGRNMIPLATAIVIAKKLGVKVDNNIVQAIKVSRTGGDGWHRLSNPPCFDGMLNDNNHVIMIDDTQTQGGTFAALKGHVEALGSNRVIGAYALTGKQYSSQLKLNETTLSELRVKYGDLENWWKSTFGYDFKKLTEWEAKYILNSGKTVDEVRNRIIASKQT
ncbi:phosphoribosyltransferase [Acinetobacter beijerinckii]|uniref:phosphoribosyltransferase n=1 Tax=Acinetobacter beijerinckii TaxID=262668 RepID=UPI0023DDE9E0|nr:hypothetical protein [Acinetobacter beijerinckii]